MSLMMGIFSNLFDFIWDIVSLIPKFVYFLSMTLASFLDLAQLALRKIAGLDAYYLDGVTQPQTGDIVLAFIRGIFEQNSRFPALKNAFWALVVLAFVLIILTTIIAIIRQEYANNKELTTMNIVKRAVKGMFMFFIVPMSVLFGLLFSDIILKALDSATAGGQASGEIFSKAGVFDTINDQGNIENGVLLGQEMYGGQETTYLYYDIFGISLPSRNVTFSGMIFKSAAYNANRVRINKTYKYYVGGQEIQTNFYGLMTGENPKISNFDLFNKASNSYDAALMIDEAFAGNVHLQNPERLIFEGPAKNDVDSTLVFKKLFKVSNFSKYDVALVWYYYDLWQFNFIIAFAFYFVSLKMMVKIVAGLAKRIIEMIALFLISPPIIALMPLDNEDALKKWRQNFLSKALMAYGAIIGMNLIYLILPYLYEIQFFDPSFFNVLPSAGNPIRLVNTLISTLFMLVALLTVEDFIGLLSGLIGSKSAAEEGKELAGKVGDLFQQSADATASAVGTATAGFVGGAKFVGRTGAAVGGGIANAFGRKITGDEKFSLPKAISNKRKYKKLSQEERASVENRYKDEWTKNDSIEAYEEYINDNDKVKHSLQDGFKNRKDRALDYNAWRESDEGRSVYNRAIETSGLQKFEDFEKAESGAGLVAYRRRLAQHRSNRYDEIVSEKRAEKRSERAKVREAKSILKTDGFKQSIRRAANTALKAGGALSTFYSFTPGALKDALERSGKVSVAKTMSMAFLGRSAGDIKREQQISKIRGEEQAKAQFYQNQNNNNNNNSQVEELARSLAEVEDKVNKLTKQKKK